MEFFCFFFLYSFKTIQDGGVECLYDESGDASGVMYSVIVFENSDVSVTRENSVDAWVSVQVKYVII